MGNNKKNTYIFISGNGNYHITYASDEATAFKYLVREVPAMEDNLNHCLEIPGVPKILDVLKDSDA